jgi:hypothetical protein
VELRQGGSQPIARIGPTGERLRNQEFGQEGSRKDLERSVRIPHAPKSVKTVRPPRAIGPKEPRTK